MKVLVASRNAKKLKELQRVLDARDVHGIELVSLKDVPEYPETPETGRTFGDNALIKARDGARNTGMVCIADDSGLAVDELNGMPGVLSARWCGSHGPDEANTNLLLNQIADVPDERRGAAFVSVCAIVLPDSLLARAAEAGLTGDAFSALNSGVEVSEPAKPGEYLARGEWRGRILREPRGENGFGYDPIFVPAEEDARVRIEYAAQNAAGAGHMNGAGHMDEGEEAQAHPTSGPRSSAELSPAEKDAQSHRGRALAQLVPVLRALGRL